MSVNVGDRSQGHYHILESIRFLCDYTTTTCEKDKYFGPDTYGLAHLLIEAAIRAVGCVEGAYGLPVFNKTCYEQRFALWGQAQSWLYQMLGFLTIARDHYSFITIRREEYWTGLINTALQDLQIVRDYDAIKYSKILKK